MGSLHRLPTTTHTLASYSIGKMGSFQRMKEEAEEMAMQVSAKLPGKTVIWTFLGVLILIVLVLVLGLLQMVPILAVDLPAKFLSIFSFLTIQRAVLDLLERTFSPP